MSRDANYSSKTTEINFGVININAYIPIILDLDELNYDQWSELFTIHCKTFRVYGYLMGTTKSTGPNDKEWDKHDNLVKLWIYGTISKELVKRVLKKNLKASDFYKNLKDVFHDNKDARAMQLNTELHNLSIGNLSITQYFTKIKDISDLLANIKAPVSEKRSMLLIKESILNRENNTSSLSSPSTPSILITTSKNRNYVITLLVAIVGLVIGVDMCMMVFAMLHLDLVLTMDRMLCILLFPQAFNTMNLKEGRNARWYMDMGAISHLPSDSDGSLSHYKAGLVANGRSQIEGIDCDETFSSVVKPATVHTVLSLALSRDWPVHQLDVKNAFLHGSLSETVYMHQLPGFTDSAHPDYWDISSLHSEFAMTDLGPFYYFLGISSLRIGSGMFLSQLKYASEILEQAHMEHCNPCQTPVDIESKLGLDGDPVADPTLYRSHVALKQILHYIRANAVAETAWLWNLLLELQSPLHSATLVYCDNVMVVTPLILLDALRNAFVNFEMICLFIIELLEQAPHPLEYVPDLMELEDHVPVYIPEPEHLEDLVPAEDEAPIEPYITEPESDIPELTRLPRKMDYIGRRVDHSFVDTVDTRVRDTEKRTMAAVEVVNLRVSYQADVRRRESLGFYSRHQEAQEDQAVVRAQIEILRRERLTYEQENIQTYDRAIEHIIRTQALEAGARIDTLEDTGSSAWYGNWKKKYAVTLPLCTKRNYHHKGQCAPKCNICKKISYLAQNCRTPAAAEYQRTLTCYECRGIDRHLGEIVFGKPFIEETGLVNDEEKGTIMFEQGDGKITFKMPYTMEIFKQIGLMGLSTDSIPRSAHKENFGHGKMHYYQSLLIGNEYKHDEGDSREIRHLMRLEKEMMDNKGEVTRNYPEEPFTHKEEMAFSDSEVHNDKPCTKSCLKNYETLKKQYDDLLAKLHESIFKASTYKRGLDTIEAQLVTYRKNEVLFSEEVVILKREVRIKQYEINVLKSELEKVKQEKDGIDFKIEKFENASKDLDKLLGSQITDNSKKGLGYSAVPPPHPLIYNRPNKLDLSYLGLEDFQQPEFEVYGLRANKSVCENSSNETKKNFDAPLIEEWVSDNEDEVESPVMEEKKTVVPTIPKVDVVRPK
ncbi:ribonuclease H-like domain-containing protein [Tanacetum coccineum]